MLVECRVHREQLRIDRGVDIRRALERQVTHRPEPFRPYGKTMREWILIVRKRKPAVMNEAPFVPSTLGLAGD